ncbi:MAG: hypothetical protein WAO52_19380 [Prolixibacteraceae bacterium]
MKNKIHDKILSELLRNDRVGEPDQAIEDRLMYSFLLKSGNAKQKQNSFSSFLVWIFSMQSLGLKTGLVSVVLFFSVMNNQFTFDSSKIHGADSISNQRFLVADTAHYIQNIDSLRRDSLN